MGQLRRDGLCLMSGMGGGETFTKVTGGDGVALELMKVNVLLVEVIYVRLHILVDLLWEEASDA